MKMEKNGLPRGYRNCNPGNIENNKDVFQGEVIPSQDSRFKQFKSMAYGYRAMFVTLDTYRKRGRNTIEKIINAWAPCNENNTNAYIDSVVKWSGVPQDKILTDCSGRDYIQIVAAMSRVENGIPAYLPEIETGFKLQDRLKGCS